jgi:hypothetical protein
VIAERDEMEGADNTGVRTNSGNCEQGRQWVASCLSDPTQLYVESRLRAPTFAKLARWLKAHGVQGGRIVSVEEKLLVFLYVCGQGSGFRNAKYRSGHSIATISQ